ncbi:MAG: dethiobiotin synthase [Polyangiaceae bacterium]|nr:dethiobiotin synthase [Polyangiaceae bacterium]
MSTGRRFVVVGTGTGVGKTAVSTAFARLARADGFAVAGLKPVLTGSDVPSDAELLGDATGRFVAPLYLFGPPVSPHLAARMAGVTIEVARIVEWVKAHESAVTIVESAGGLFSPVNDLETNADVLRALMPAEVILVCGAALGTFHATRSTLSALAREVPEAMGALTVMVSSRDGLDAGIATAAEMETLYGSAFGIGRPLVLGPGCAFSAAASVQLRRLLRR